MEEILVAKKSVLCICFLFSLIILAYNFILCSGRRSSAVAKRQGVGSHTGGSSAGGTSRPLANNPMSQGQSADNTGSSGGSSTGESGGGGGGGGGGATGGNRNGEDSVQFSSTGKLLIFILCSQHSTDSQILWLCSEQSS